MTDRVPVNHAEAEIEIVISVIIATYKAREVLADCLQSIYQNPPSEPYEIIVVDDASKDGTSEMVRARFPEVRLLCNDINLSYSRSNNRAFDQARGRYLYLLNNDTIVLPNALDKMISFLRAHPEAGAVGSKLLNEDGTLQWSVKSPPSVGAAFFGARSAITRMMPENPYSRRYLLHLGQDMREPFVVAGYISGASKMMPRRVVDEVGYLDVQMFYHVDADYCKRIEDAGYKCYYLPTAEVVHLNHKGGSMVSPRRRFRSLLEFHAHSYLYYRKHLRRSAWNPMHIIVLVGLVARLLVSITAQAVAELVLMTRSSSVQRDQVRATSIDGNRTETTSVSPIASQK
jgi:GT2 family glycosyltransferase